MDEKRIKNKALAKALNIIECFTVDNPELGITEICNMLNLNKGNVHDIITTFEAYGYVKKNTMNNRYHLHSSVLRLAGIMNRSRPQKDTIATLVREIAQETGETVYYGILSGRSVLYLDYMSSASLVVPKQVVGVSAPLYCTSTGKALLAEMDEVEVDEILAKGLKGFTDHTLTDIAMLKADLALTRERGYSIDNMEHEFGVKGVGMTVRDMDGKVVAAISVSGPSLRFTDETIPKIADLIRSHSRNMAITYF